MAWTDKSTQLLPHDLCPEPHSGTEGNQDRLAYRGNLMLPLIGGNLSPQLSQSRAVQFLGQWGRLSGPSECRQLLLLMYIAVQVLLEVQAHLDLLSIQVDSMVGDIGFSLTLSLSRADNGYDGS